MNRVTSESIIADVEFAAIDFESAGVAPGDTDSPVQVGLAVLRDGKIESASFFRSFIAANRPVTWAARKVHGISDGDLIGAPPLLQLWPRIREALDGRCVVAHAVGTEKRFLRAFPFHGFAPWLDTLKLAHAAYPDLDSHSLGNVVEAAGLADRVDALCPELTWHDGLYDSIASLVFLRHVIRETQLADYPLDCLLHPNRTSYFKQRRRRAR